MTIKTWAGIIVGISLMLCNQSMAADLGRPDHLEKAKLALKMGQYRQAVEALTQLIETKAGDADIYFKRGLAHEKLGHNQRAISDYTKALGIRPKIETAFNNRGVIYYRLGEYRKAVEDFSHAVRLNPGYALAYYNRGNAYHAAGDLDRSIADFTRSIEINPDYANAYNNRGWTKLQKNQAKASIGDFDRALQIDPRYTLAFCNRGRARLSIGDGCGSIKDFFRAMELDHRFAKNYFRINIAQSGHTSNDELFRKPKEPAASSYKVLAWDLFKKADYIAATSGSMGAVALNKAPSIVRSNRNSENTLPDEQSVLNFLAAWRSAWEEKDIGGYARMYVPDFKQGSMDYNMFVKSKRYFFRKYKNIRVETDQVEIKTVGNEIILRFIQSFQGDDYHDKGWKRMVLTRDEETDFKIVEEEWTPANDFALASR